jgi:hypothetical protein
MSIFIITVVNFHQPAANGHGQVELLNKSIVCLLGTNILVLYRLLRKLEFALNNMLRKSKSKYDKIKQIKIKLIIVNVKFLKNEIINNSIDIELRT